MNETSDPYRSIEMNQARLIINVTDCFVRGRGNKCVLQALDALDVLKLFSLGHHVWYRVDLSVLLLYNELFW